MSIVDGFLNPLLNYFLSERVKDHVIKTSRSRLDVLTTIDSVDVRINSIYLKNLTIKQPSAYDDGHPLIEAKQIKVDYSLINLLFGKTLNLQSVSFEDIQVNVIKKNLGLKNNNIDLLRKKALESATMAKRPTHIDVLNVDHLKIKVKGPLMTMNFGPYKFQLHHTGFTEDHKLLFGLTKEDLAENIIKLITSFFI